jgi:hypothetical protein
MINFYLEKDLLRLFDFNFNFIELLLILRLKLEINYMDLFNYFSDSIID